MMSYDPAGHLANKNGKWLEGIIASQLRQAGYYELTPAEKKLFLRQDGILIIPQTKWFAQQVRLERNLYEARFTSDFYVSGSESFPDGLHIESKWQGSAGSVDEKYVFTALSLLSFKCHSVIVLSGGGARRGAVKWLKTQASKSRGKFKFFTLEEFVAWVRDYL